MKIDLVLTSCDMNKKYIEYFPIIYNIWRNSFNLEICLILIADEIPEILKEYKNNIILFPPIENVHTAYISQTVRILYPALFKNKNILITDCDILPVSKKYFIDSILSYDNDKFISYRDAYIKQNMIAICYNVANSKVWSSIFDINSIDDIKNKLIEWYNPLYDGTKNCPGWFTDQEKLFNYIDKWDNKSIDLIMLNDKELSFNRLDKRDTQYILDNKELILEKINNNEYTDFHIYRNHHKTPNILKSIINQIIELNKDNYKKILFVENISIDNDNTMSTLYPMKCELIKNNINFKVYNLGDELNKGIELNRIKEYLENCNIILFGCRSIHLYKTYKSPVKQTLYDINKIILENSIDKKKFILLQDIHQKTYNDLHVLGEYLNTNNINIIYTFYNCYEAKIINRYTPNCKKYWLPHHINTGIFNYKNGPKIYDILLYGTVHSVHYPFRKRLFDIILNNKIFEVYNIKFIPRPDEFNPEICEEGLADILSSSKITISTNSKYDYLVAKYFEIAACKSLIAGNMAKDGIDIFKDNYLTLNNSMSDDEIIKLLIETIDNFDKYSEQINSMYNKVISEFNFDRYLEKLIEILH
jgi:hypothetical protein